MICLVLPQKMSLAQCEIQSSCFTFVRVFAMVTVTVMHLKNNAQDELILVYPIWARVHKIYSSCLEQDNAETVGGMATQSTVLCVPLGLISVTS